MPEETSRPLPGTVKYYERHLFICTGSTDWPPRLELGGGFPQALAEAIASHANLIQSPVKITACDLPATGPPGGVDLLVFPDGVRYTGLTEADLPALVTDQLIANRTSDRLARLPLTDQFVFVCVHGARDERCGQCGPPLAARFKAELAARNVTAAITVAQTSHVGGHAYAGNVLIYPGGDWYGLVALEDVSRLIESALLRGQILDDRWRGRMALLPEQQVALSRR